MTGRDTPVGAVPSIDCAAGSARCARLACWLVLCAVMLATPLLAHAVDVRAWLDRDTMHMGETITLNVEVDSAISAQPDFSALGQDFKVLSTQSSHQFSLVNGSSSSKTVWAVGLEPLHAGHLAIPPLPVGNQQTNALDLTVVAAPAGAQGKVGDDVFLDVSAEPDAPYVQQQVRYAVKLYYAFNLTNGDLGEPKADGFVTQRLGSDSNYIAEVGGRRYHVVERHYALTPERSGELVVPALEFRGSAMSGSDPTGFFSRGRNVSARSDAITLNVRPQPADFSGTSWLPAASLILQDQSPPPTEVHVGEPITRTIRLQAKGLGYEQLPEITLTSVAGAEAYPDKEQTRTRDDGTWLVGERVRKFAFVPGLPGMLTIPGLSVKWWDTTEDRARTTALPAQTVNVLPAVGATSSAGSPPTASHDESPAPQQVTSAPSAPPTANGGVRRWQILAAAGLLLWLITLALWLLSRRAPRIPFDAVEQQVPPGVARARSTFLRACAMADIVGAERALLAWARSLRPDLHNLGEVAEQLDDEGQRETLAELARVRYAAGKADGLAQRLESAFKRGFRWRGAPGKADAADEVLPPLYPRDR